MPLGIEKYEKLLKGVDNKSRKEIRAELKQGQFAENIIDALKQAYTNVNTVLHREKSNPDIDSRDIERNKTLFNQLLKISAKDGVDLSDLKNKLIDRLTRDLNSYKNSGKTMDDEKHPLYQMGQAFIDHDIKAEAQQIGKEARAAMQKNTPQRPNTQRKEEKGKFR